MNRKGKVFGIGFQKTATTSLAVSLYMLGYNVTGHFGVLDPEISTKVYDYAYALADRFDAAQDTPWPVLYRELDRRYPNSKFVLTTRSSDRWVKSVVKHFGHREIPTHQWIYGVESAAGNEDIYIQRYEAHNREVIEYFKGRPDDLLVMDITQGDGWELLCPFLGVDIPSAPFPVANPAEKRAHLFGILPEHLRWKLSMLFASKGKRELMERGVSAEFIRDIVHYHYSMYENLWDSINQLSEDEFSSNTNFSGESVREHLLKQIAEELFWLSYLQCEHGRKTVNIIDYQDKESVYSFWDDTRFQFRGYIGSTIDIGINENVRERENWEIIVHLINRGTEQRSYIRSILKEFDVMVADDNLLDFFGTTDRERVVISTQKQLTVKE
jgi:hypothetical protein